MNFEVSELLFGNTVIRSRRDMFARAFMVFGFLILAACTTYESQQAPTLSRGDSDNDFGVLVMAHGGSSDWNTAVEESLDVLRKRYPVEIAFGMADAGSLESAVRRLEAKGVAHVGVVRMFISGESWYERTLQILGELEGAPAKNQSNHSSLNPRMPMGFWQIETDLVFHVSKEGLADAEEMDEVLLSRVSKLSSDPASEVVAVIAHGPADDSENNRWLAKISERTNLLKRDLGVKDIEVFTLREDWEEKRAGAEELIRSYIQQANDAGLHPIVVPYRVQGFGPYATVLEGLDYSADHLGLVPHDNIALWIKNQVDEVLTAVDQHRARLAQFSDR